MKLEIEITEHVVEALARSAATAAVKQQCEHWASSEYVRSEVKKVWMMEITDEIRRQLADSENIKKAVRDAIEKKIKSQLVALSKETLL